MIMIIRLFLKWILISLAVLVLPYLIPGIIIATTTTGLIAGAVIGLINMLVKPIVKVITLPLNVLTIGLFGVFINAVLFWVGSLFVPGFEILTYGAGIIGSIIVALAWWVINKAL